MSRAMRYRPITSEGGWAGKLRSVLRQSAIGRVSCLLALGIIVTVSAVACGSDEEVAIVIVSQDVKDEIDSWDFFSGEIAFYTPAANPVTSLRGLSADEIRLRGPTDVEFLAQLTPRNAQDLFVASSRLFEAVGEPKIEHLATFGDADNLFIDFPEIRLFVTWAIRKNFDPNLPLDSVKIRFEVE